MQTDRFPHNTMVDYRPGVCRCAKLLPGGNFTHTAGFEYSPLLASLDIAETSFALLLLAAQVAAFFDYQHITLKSGKGGSERDAEIV